MSRGPWEYRKIDQDSLKRLKDFRYQGKNGKPRMFLTLDGEETYFCPECPMCGSDEIEINLMYITDVPAGKFAGILYCEKCGIDKKAWGFGNNI